LLTLDFYITSTIYYCKRSEYVTLSTCTGRRKSHPVLSRWQWLTRIVSCWGRITRLRCLDCAV